MVLKFRRWLSPPAPVGSVNLKDPQVAIVINLLWSMGLLRGSAPPWFF